jgi:uncharacterized protein YndB with AHSA1/START domain
MQSERELKVELEHSYSIFIRATSAQVWQALTDSSFTTQYYFDSAVESDWRVGSDYRMTSPDGTRVSFEGTILALEPERRLVQSVHIKFHPAFLAHENMSIAWDIEQFGEACRVTITHHGAPSTAELFAMLTARCPDLLSGMKTLLETGRPLRIGQPETAHNAGGPA